MIQCHEVLHDGINKKGTGPATIELKLAQQLAFLDQKPWHQIFLDLHKAYDTMDWEKALEILADCGVSPKALRVIRRFWTHTKLVCRTGGCYGDPFTAHRGVTQGGPLSSLIFNVVVDAVVREWLQQTLDDDAARDGLLMAQSATRMVSFYVNDGVLSAIDPVWLQSAFNVLITLFEQIDLKTNTKKTQVMTCVPGKIRESLSEEVYHDSRMGLLSLADRKRLCVNCDICGEKL